MILLPGTSVKKSFIKFLELITTEETSNPTAKYSLNLTSVDWKNSVSVELNLVEILLHPAATIKDFYKE